MSSGLNGSANSAKHNQCNVSNDQKHPLWLAPLYIFQNGRFAVKYKSMKTEKVVRNAAQPERCANYFQVCDKKNG